MDKKHPSVVLPDSYRYIKEIGGGTYGEVWLVQNTQKNRREVVKILRRIGSDIAEQQHRFAREIKTMTMLKHPNIVTIYYAKPEESYFIMEYLELGSLSSYLAGNQCPLPQSLHLLTQVATALHYAHRKNLVHRDLKPHNILLSAKMVPKITDFGLVKSSDSDTLTASHANLGTPRYMAPEQWQDSKRVDHRCDIWALGIILYEILAKQPPFPGLSGIALAYAISESPMPLPSQINPDLDKLGRSVESICMKALRKDKHKRYQSLADMVYEIQRYLDKFADLDAESSLWRQQMNSSASKKSKKAPGSSPAYRKKYHRVANVFEVVRKYFGEKPRADGAMLASEKANEELLASEEILDSEKADEEILDSEKADEEILDSEKADSELETPFIQHSIKLPKTQKMPNHPSRPSTRSRKRFQLQLSLTTNINDIDGFHYVFTQESACNGQKNVLKIYRHNTTDLEFALLPGGTFSMGAKNIGYMVTLSAFLIARYPITQRVWMEIMGHNPSSSKGAEKPVDKVSWIDTQKFCKKLNVKLPTEAQWEFACKAGVSNIFYWGDEIDARYLWYKKNSRGQLHAVGEKRPNAYGIYDMSGNVYEWCEDWYGGYIGMEVTDPVGPEIGTDRVLRGGSWRSSALRCSSEERFHMSPDYRGHGIGFRVVKELPERE